MVCYEWWGDHLLHVCYCEVLVTEVLSFLPLRTFTNTLGLNDFPAENAREGRSTRAKLKKGMERSRTRSRIGPRYFIPDRKRDRKTGQKWNPLDGLDASASFSLLAFGNKNPLPGEAPAIHGKRCAASKPLCL